MASRQKKLALRPNKSARRLRSLPLVGVNTFLPKQHAGEVATEIELIRSGQNEDGGNQFVRRIGGSSL